MLAAYEPTPAGLDRPELPSADQVVHQFPADAERGSYLIRAIGKPGLAIGGRSGRVVVGQDAPPRVGIRERRTNGRAWAWPPRGIPVCF